MAQLNGAGNNTVTRHRAATTIQNSCWIWIKIWWRTAITQGIFDHLYQKSKYPLWEKFITHPDLPKLLLSREVFSFSLSVGYGHPGFQKEVLYWKIQKNPANFEFWNLPDTLGCNTVSQDKDPGTFVQGLNGSWDFFAFFNRCQLLHCSTGVWKFFWGPLPSVVFIIGIFAAGNQPVDLFLSEVPTTWRWLEHPFNERFVDVFVSLLRNRKIGRSLDHRISKSKGGDGFTEISERKKHYK